MKKRILFVLCCFCLFSHAQPFETGKIIDSLAVGNSDTETFALYLPSTYDAHTLSPIVFIFSPSGNGKNGVKTFIKSAEAYNHILICSNNSQNGSIELNLNIAQRLFDHVFSNFNILENRIYLAGFSGGSRLATAIASSSNQIEGVIACGAGFISSPSYIPSKQSFSYAGLCGERDMNYQEMLDVRSYLNHAKIHNTLFSFDGNHQWPPDEQLLMAFNWLEIEAIKKGNVKKSKDSIKERYLNDFKRVKILEKKNQPLIVSEHYERILNTYGSFFNLDSISQKLQNTKKSKHYSKTLKDRKKAFEKEDILTSLFLDRFDKTYYNQKKPNMKWWHRELEKLKKQEVKANAQIIKMHERVRFKIFVAAYMKSLKDTTNMSQQQRDFCTSIISLLAANRKTKNEKKAN